MISTEFALKNMVYKKGSIVMLNRYHLRITHIGLDNVFSQYKEGSTKIWGEQFSRRLEGSISDLESCMQESIEGKGADINSVVFDHQGNMYNYSGFAAPGNDGAHYEWVDSDPMAK